MSLEGNNSYKNRQDRILLDGLNHAILVLKVKSQNRPSVVFTDVDVKQSRSFILNFLSNLVDTISFLLNVVESNESQHLQLDYVNIATRFIQANSHDKRGALDNMRELYNYLRQGNQLDVDDFAYLDRLQTFLEKEVDEAIRGLYRL